MEDQMAGDMTQEEEAELFSLYENRITHEELKREYRRVINAQHAFFDAINTMDEVPSREALWFLIDARAPHAFPDCWSIGKEMQRRIPGSVPWKTELEIAAGIWTCMREGFLARFPDIAPKAEEN
jgi:hypothetical protein